MQQEQVRSIVYALQQNVRRVIVGKEDAIELALIALLAKGHVLIEDLGAFNLLRMLCPVISQALPCHRCRRAKWSSSPVPS